MEKHVFQTPMGEAWLWCADDPVESGKPLVLAIEGAFAIPRPRSFELAGFLPEATVLNAHLPGNHCPSTAEHSVVAYAALYAAVLRQIDRPALVMGSSIGALVALALRDADVKGLVLAEPPLRTAKLWPLTAGLRKRLAQEPDRPATRDFLLNVFGISAAALEDRDYRGLLDDLRIPAWALFGGDPLNPPRTISRLPSLVDEPERNLLRAQRMVQTMQVPGIGHNVAGPGILSVRRCLRDLLQREFGAIAP